MGGIEAGRGREIGRRGGKMGEREKGRKRGRKRGCVGVIISSLARIYWNLSRYKGSTRKGGGADIRDTREPPTGTL